MNSPQLAVATEDLASDLRRGIDAAARLKVQGVRLNTRRELDVHRVSETGLRQILRAIRERQMRVAGLYCPTRHAIYQDEFLDPRLDVIRRSMALCQKLQTSELLVRTGRIPERSGSAEPDEPESDSVNTLENPFSFSSSATAGSKKKASPAEEFAVMTEILNDLAAYGNRVGCVLNLVLPDFDVSRVRALLSAVHAGPVKIVMDTATAVLTRTSPVSVFRQFFQEIGYVRARDAVPDVDGQGVETSIPEGNVDWVEFLPTLVEAEYRGWVCVERTSGDRRSEDVHRGVEYLRQLLPHST